MSGKGSRPTHHDVDPMFPPFSGQVSGEYLRQWGYQGVAKIFRLPKMMAMCFRWNRTQARLASGQKANTLSDNYKPDSGSSTCALRLLHVTATPPLETAAVSLHAKVQGPCQRPPVDAWLYVGGLLNRLC